MNVMEMFSKEKGPHMRPFFLSEGRGSSTAK